MTQQEQPKVFLFTGDLKALVKKCRHEIAQNGRVSIHSLEPAKFQPKMAFDGVKLQQVSLLVSHEDSEELLSAFIETTELMDDECRERLLMEAILKLQDELELKKELEFPLGKAPIVEDNDKPERDTLPSDDNPA